MSTKPRPESAIIETGVRSRRLPGDRPSPLERNLTELFDRLFAPVNPLRSVAERHWHPFSDLYESETHFMVRMELAGIDPERLEIVKDGNCLIVRGHRDDPLVGRGLACHQLEISHGAFERVICLPEDFTEEGVSADYGRRSGFLEITIEKDIR
jgi:HSP20 family protein